MSNIFRLSHSTRKEILDDPSGNAVSDADYVKAARSLKTSNALSFHHQSVWGYVRRFIVGLPVVRILDVGTGVADFPIYFAQQLAKGAVPYELTGIDDSRLVISLAKQATAADRNITIERKRIQELTQKYDIITASQFIHHLLPDEVVQFMKDASAMATRAVIISDFDRSAFMYCVVSLFTWISGSSKIARIDGRRSILRSYTDSEIRTMLAKAGVTDYAIESKLFRKFIIIPLAHR